MDDYRKLLESVRRLDRVHDAGAIDAYGYHMKLLRLLSSADSSTLDHIRDALIRDAERMGY